MKRRFVIYSLLCAAVVLHGGICALAADTNAAAVSVSSSASNKGKTNRKALEKAVQKAPGNSETRCELVGLLLAEADTVAAEEQLDYGQKLGEAGCLHLYRARIAWNRGRTMDAAMSCAAAVKAGLMPDEEPFLHKVDSLTDGLVRTRLERILLRERGCTEAEQGIHLLDSLREASTTFAADSLVSSDTSDTSDISDLSDQSDASDNSDPAISFTRQAGKMELTAKLNGLKMKMELDTTATQSTISTVETAFLLKNNYVSRGDVIDDKILLIRELDFGDGLVLRGVRLYYEHGKDSGIILCLDDLRKLGTLTIDEEGKKIRLKTNHSTQPL